jgi:hypothetical protein
MSVLEINSPEVYEESLKRLDELWSKRPGDKEWEERYSLIEAIVKYEDEHYPIPLPDPIDALRFRMDQEGLLNTRNCLSCEECLVTPSSTGSGIYKAYCKKYAQNITQQFRYEKDLRDACVIPVWCNLAKEL